MRSCLMTAKGILVEYRLVESLVGTLPLLYMMTLGLFGNPNYSANFFLTIFLIPLAILALILRFIAVRRSGMLHQSEHWLALASLVAYLAFSGVTLGGESILTICSSGLQFIFLQTLLTQVFSSRSRHHRRWSIHTWSPRGPGRSCGRKKGIVTPPCKLGEL